MALSSMISMTGELYKASKFSNKKVVEPNDSEESDAENNKDHFKLPQLEKYYTIIDPL